jgi:hypothetical protein
VLGARNGNSTLTSLAKWILETKKGVIFADEIDKLGGGSGGERGEWTNAILLDLHGLLDSRIADGALQIDENVANEIFAGKLDNSACKCLMKFDIEEKLKSSFLIVGAGTWQKSWMEKRSFIGFRDDESEQKTIDQRETIKSISPEILMRFCSEIFFLEPMKESDYRMKAGIQHLSERQRARFAELTNAAIPGREAWWWIANAMFDPMPEVVSTFEDGSTNPD